MAIELTDSVALSLDFWQDTVIYERHSFPAGTLGCDSLNIPETVIERLGELCAGLNLVMGAAAAAELTAPLLETVHYRIQIEKTFSPNRVDFINDYANALISGEATFFEERYKDALLFFRLLPVMAQLGFSLREFQTAMLRFAEELNKPDCQRTPEGYAAVFGAFFPPALTLDNGSGWMSLTNSTVQYASAQRPEQGGAMLVKRIHFVSFVRTCLKSSK